MPLALGCASRLSPTQCFGETLPTYRRNIAHLSAKHYQQSSNQLFNLNRIVVSFGLRR
ncbi:MAG: hypothetical protein LBI18_01055 [Planctomycetaceae bacterium]|nr:hypothetical protein [Planctomycetaceae bacterium]